jgi:hypothetical protein
VETVELLVEDVGAQVPPLIQPCVFGGHGVVLTATCVVMVVDESHRGVAPQEHGLDDGVIPGLIEVARLAPHIFPGHWPSELGGKRVGLLQLQ